MQSYANYSNRYLDADMNRVEIAAVQQVNDRAFFRRGGLWVDSRLAQRVAVADVKRVIAFGSPEYFALLARLTGENRQGCVSLKGNILLDVGGEGVLIRSPEPARVDTLDAIPLDGC